MSEVVVNCKLARKFSLENIPDSLAYLLVKVTPDSSFEFGHIPLNIGLVIDVSRSMKKRKIACALAAAKYIVASLNEDDRVSVITFSDEARVVVPLSKASDKASILYAIDRIRIQSGTRMYHGMEMGAREVSKIELTNTVNRMIVLTDGETEGEDICKTIAEMEKRNGIAISTLGIGDKYNEDLLAEIANITVGNFFHLRTPEQIQELFQKEVEDAAGLIISNVNLSLNLADSVFVESFDRVFPSYIRLQPLKERDGRIYTISIGNISKDEPTIFGIRLRLPARPAGQLKIAEVCCTYNIPDIQVEDRVEKSDIIIEYTDNEDLCSKVDTEVIDYFNQVNVQNLVEKAIEESKRGDTTGATKTLSQAREITEKLGNVPLFDSITGALTELEKKGEVTAEGIKDIKAGSLRTVKISEEQLK